MRVFQSFEDVDLLGQVLLELLRQLGDLYDLDGGEGFEFLEILLSAFDHNPIILSTSLMRPIQSHSLIGPSPCLFRTNERYEPTRCWAR